MPSTVTTEHVGSGGRLVAVDGKLLPLKGVSLEAEAAGGLARVRLRQAFTNPWQEPLKVTYTVPLPADGAVSDYRMTVGERVIVGEIEKRAVAQERFDRAMVEGRTASLLEQERGNVFTQSLGNVPAGADVEIELVLDQRLSWIPDGSGQWEWRFPTVVSPRYMGGAGRVPDVEKVSVDVGDGPTGIQASLRLAIGDQFTGDARPESPSHAIRTEGVMVSLEGEGTRLDRDIVIRWSVGQQEPGLTLLRGRPQKDRPHADHAYGLLTIVPPESTDEALARDLILLIDTSGSMHGQPLNRAKSVLYGLIDSLSEQDRLEMISFSMRPRRWKKKPVAAIEETRLDARWWVEKLEAGGGTEMTSGLEEALRPLREQAQRQVVLITDGQIGFEHEIVAMLRDRLPHGSRLHTVGVGSAVNRALTGPAARAGRGTEVVVDLDESVERAGARIVSATRKPILVNVTIEGSAVQGHEPRQLPDVMAGRPCLTGIRLDPTGGELVVTADGPAGTWRQSLTVPPTGPGEGSDTIVKLCGREIVEELELDLAAGQDRKAIDLSVEKIGLQFGIATRLTSWVAISQEKDVDPREPVRTTRIPQELPYGMSAEGLGLRAGHTGAVMMQTLAAPLDERFMEADIRPRFGWGFHITHDFLPETASVSGRWLAPPEEGLRILEVTIEEGHVDWKPEGAAHLMLPDGSVIEATIDPYRSTRGGTFTRGQLFRMALEIDLENVEDVMVVLVNSKRGLLRVLLP